MKDLLDKLSSYNIFNYLLPGVLFAYALDNVSTYNLTTMNMVIGVFIYYFLGLVISRIGSLILDPILKKIGFIKFAPYADFVAGVKADPKIEVLSEMNNTYRTLCAMVLLIVVIKLYDRLTLELPVLIEYTTYIATFALLVLFLFSYRKQTEYIKKRVAVSHSTAKK